MRVAFIVQRCGVEVNGGAEAHCLQIAQRMSQHWQTEVLTTCALDYMTWQDHYPPGPEEAGGTIIRRFPIDHPRDVESFNRRSSELHARQGDAAITEQEEWMRAQGPMSSALLDYLGGNRDEYDAFIFFGYLYATTYFGLPVVQEKAFLAPLAHDEWTIYFNMWDRFFELPQRFVFNTTFERDFLTRRFPHVRFEGPVIALGVEPPVKVDPAGFRARYRLHEPFLLYVGRIDESKGCRSLIENFMAARDAGTIDAKLVLAGTEVMPVPFHDDVIYLGFIDEQQKWDGMAACDWLVMPSPHESLSMVLLEVWAVGRPALVTAEGDVLRGQCARANAGLWYRDWNELEVILRATDEATKAALGRQGRAFVTSHYSWVRVESDYLDLLQSSVSSNSVPA